MGLPLDEDARGHLKSRLEELLAAVADIPADAAYRQSVEATVRHKLAALNSDSPDEALEETFGRQLEQVKSWAWYAQAALPTLCSFRFIIYNQRDLGPATRSVFRARRATHVFIALLW